MAQYIDKDALVAEIERIRRIEVTNNDVAYNGALDEIRYFLNTHEVEVDLNEEIESYFKGFGKFASVGIDDCIDIAKHFFELGVRVQKKEKYEVPSVSKTEDISVTSRMTMIDDDLKPIAEFILDYAGWNLHKDEWNHPVLEVPLFRVLDALIQRGKPYCGKN